jgi:ribosomal protein L15
MLLHQLKKSKGYNKPGKRLGRGNASGKGNYSTRGIK